MCDQFFGFNAKRSGGLFVLEQPFSDQPAVRDLLANAVCESGRLQGRKLDNGGFLSPTLSYDAKEIMFALPKPTRARASGRRKARSTCSGSTATARDCGK